MLFNILIAVAVFVFFRTVLQSWLFKLRQSFFAYYLNNISEYLHKATIHFKTDLLSQLHYTLSSDPELRKKKQIRILEIGAGSGTNFKFFPDHSNLIFVDVNESFKKILLKNIKNYPKLHLEKYLLTDAADMKELPDGSVDAVIGQFVLCSCDNVPGVLDEVKRILVPGGTFYFMEHVVDRLGTLRRRVQQFMHVTGIWPFFTCGCNVAKDTGIYFRNASFNKLDMKDFSLDTKYHWSFHFSKPIIAGTATK